MKTAIVHDWLVVYGGAERVLEQIVDLYPDADLFALFDFLPEQHRDIIRHKPVNTSFLQHAPFARKRYRQYLPFMPLAIEQLDLSAYDLIISSSHAVAKGVLTNSHQVHVSYLNNFMGYAWEMYHPYLRDAGLDRGFKGMLAKWFLHYIRMWDVQSAHCVDQFVANSKYMSAVVQRLYGRSSTVIYPPVALDQFQLGSNRDNYYVTAARLVSWKRIDIIVQAFSQMPDKRLIVLGDGPELVKLKKIAGTNIEFLGFQPANTVRDYVQKASAFVMASLEPFGIVSVEAQACGTPVIAYSRGGAAETVVKDVTGLFFDSQDAGSIKQAVLAFEQRRGKFDPHTIRENALQFSVYRFRAEFKSFVDRVAAQR